MKQDDGVTREMDTFIAPTDRADLLRTAVTQAVDFLREGEVVALPSETVYGLAAIQPRWPVFLKPRSAPLLIR